MTCLFHQGRWLGSPSGIVICSATVLRLVLQVSIVISHPPKPPVFLLFVHFRLLLRRGAAVSPMFQHLLAPVFEAELPAHFSLGSDLWWASVFVLAPRFRHVAFRMYSLGTALFVVEKKDKKNNEIITRTVI